MLYRIIAIAYVAIVSAGSVELVSGDLGKSGCNLDNIKGKVSQAVKLFGRDTTLEASYDRSEKEDGLNELSVSGDSGPLKYRLASRMSSSVAYELSSKMSDGTTLEAEGSFDGMEKGLQMSKVKASKAVNVRNTDCDVELEHDFGSSESKVSLSSVLGGGIKATGTLTAKDGKGTAAYEVGYDASLSEGRTISATVSPADGSGEVEYEDSATLDATIKATFPLGGTPKVNIRRAFAF